MPIIDGKWKSNTPFGVKEFSAHKTRLRMEYNMTSDVHERLLLWNTIKRMDLYKERMKQDGI